MLYREITEGASATDYQDYLQCALALGVIPIDNTLVDRAGQLIPDAGWFWDHAEERHKIAQDYLFVNYVCTSGKHDPLEFRLFRKEEVCQARKEPFRNHTKLCCDLIDWVCAEHPR